MEAKARGFIIKPASTARHIDFLGNAMLMSERAHLSFGVWDAVLKNIPESEKAKVLAEVSSSVPSTHIHVSRCFVAESEATGEIAGSLCVFPYPECSMTKTCKAVYKLLESKYGHTADQIQEIDASLDFLDEAFPDIEYDSSYMLEGVFTSASFRGQGVAGLLIDHARETFCATDRNQFKKILISCSIGNDSAFRAYQKAGFALVGSGQSNQCQQVLGSAGFHMLRCSL